MQKAKERYSKEKAVEYCLSKNWYNNLPKEQKDKIKEYQKIRYTQLIQYKKEALENNEFCFYSI